MPESQLAIVLHTHMPYVEGYGTWPFGEEWLWEAIATSYLPLLDVIDERITLSLTPVLCDQLEAPGVIDRGLAFLEEVRPASHALDRQDYAGDPAAQAALIHSQTAYASAAARLRALGSDGLLAALGAHATWTSSATHAILPLLCLDDAIRLQLDTGIASHRRRFGAWGGGFWLPECAYAPWIDARLEEAGIRSVCLELRGVDLGRPLLSPAGVLLWPIDRPVIDLVWGADGYPSRAPYLAREATTPRHHRIWANHGGIYEPEAAARQAAADAAEFVAHVKALGRLSVFTIDTELLGHWWLEGPAWLSAVLQEADRQGLALTTLDAVDLDPVPAPDLGVSSWGLGGDLRNWSSEMAADLAWGLRSAELRTFGAGRRPSAVALRELLALQASDWAFLEYRGWAGPYSRERHHGHLTALERALAGHGSGPRHLAPGLIEP